MDQRTQSDEPVTWYEVGKEVLNECDFELVWLMGENKYNRNAVLDSSDQWLLVSSTGCDFFNSARMSFLTSAAFFNTRISCLAWTGAYI